jgi:hypothetical protein
VYDPARGRVVVFGGYQSYGSYYLNDVWALWLADISTGVGDGESRSPISLLRPPVPNPARGTITVSYCIANAGRVQLGVYDVSGRLVRRLVDGERSAGTATVVWNGMNESGSRLGTGIYFIRLTGPGIQETRKVVLLRN